MRRIDYGPSLFIPSKTNTEYKTILGENLERIKFKNLKGAKELIEKYEGVGSVPIYGQRRFEYTYISDTQKNDIEWNLQDIVVANLDIEVGSEDGFPNPDVAKEPITAITVKRSGHFHVFGIGDFTHNRNDLTYYQCKDEIALLEKFLDVWSSDYPDIITGWNCKFFDIPYLVNRIVKLMGETYAKKLSPWASLRLETSEFMEAERSSYKLVGIAVWDYLQLFRKYSKNGKSQESYKLDAIAWAVLKKRKLDYGKYTNLRRLYIENHQLFIEYNIYDVELVDEIDAKEKLIELCLTMAYDAKVNYEDVFSQVRMWDIIIYNHLKAKNLVIPPITVNTKNEKYAGAYVKDPMVGLHKWVASFDLTSLYPHLIMQFNISPETLIYPGNYSQGMFDILKSDISVESFLAGGMSVLTDELTKEKVTLTPNKQFFTIEKHGFLPEIMEKMFNDRARYKKLMLEYESKAQEESDPVEKKKLLYLVSKYDNLQRSKKECLNSAYGALGNQWFRFFAIPLAEAITLSGQLVIQWIAQNVNKYINGLLKTENIDYIIASDTDSIYINMAGIIDLVFGDKTSNVNEVITTMDKICKDKIHPHIQKQCELLGKYLNVYAQKMDMKREALANKGIWTAKKRYILNVFNSEGVQYAEPKMKISGLDAIKSSTPSSCRDKIKAALKIILNGSEDDMLDFIEDFRDEFEGLPVEDISFPRSVNGITQYDGWETNDVFKKGTPQHVKAALYYNREILKRKLQDKYELIKEGEKIKFIHLKNPNPFMTMILAFLVRPPDEFQLKKWIDYDEQFQKAFIDPLKPILDCVKWKVERTNSLFG